MGTYMDKIENVYKEHARHMKAEAFKIVEDEHLAENAVHNVFENLIKRETYPSDLGDTRAAFYLNKAARNEAKRIYKREHKHGFPENIDDSFNVSSPLMTEDIVINKNSAREVADFIKNENSMYSDMFILHYWMNYTIKELAEMFDVNSSNAEKGINRLKAKIAEEFKKEK